MRGVLRRREAPGEGRVLGGDTDLVRGSPLRNTPLVRGSVLLRREGPHQGRVEDTPLVRGVLRRREGPHQGRLSSG